MIAIYFKQLLIDKFIRLLEHKFVDSLSLSVVSFPTHVHTHRHRHTYAISANTYAPHTIDGAIRTHSLCNSLRSFFFSNSSLFTFLLCVEMPQVYWLFHYTFNNELAMYICVRERECVCACMHMYWLHSNCLLLLCLSAHAHMIFSWVCTHTTVCCCALTYTHSYDDVEEEEEETQTFFPSH